jgi:spore coat protein U-like protein
MLAPIFLCGGIALAGTGTSTLTAIASVNSNCTIATSGIAFGSYDPIVTHKTVNLDAIGSITVACTKGIAPTIALGLGNNAAGNTRRMSSGTDFLVYELYKPSNNATGTACSFPGTTVWGNAGANLFSTTTTANKNLRTYNVCGTAPAGQNPAVGTYSDTVVATVTF